MDFKAYVMKGVELVKLNRDMAEEVSRDENAFTPAVLFFAIGGLAGGIGAIFSGGAGSLILIMPIVAVAASFIGVGILYLLARLFGGAGDFKGYYSALGIGYLTAWAGVIPFLGAVLSLWGIPVAVIITERVHRISMGKAVAVVLIPVAVVFLVAMLAFAGFMAFLTMAGKTPI